MDDTNVTYRLATHDDIGVVVVLSQEWAQEGCTRGQRATTPDALMAHLGPYFIVGATDSGQIVAFAIGKACTEHACVFPRGETYLLLSEVFVSGGFRRQGIGTGLVTALMQSARDQGIRYFTTYTANRNWERTLGFYARFGFQVWTVSMFCTE